MLTWNILLATLTLALAPLQARAGYLFVKIADANATFGQLGNQPALNAGGTVAFQGANGIFTGNGGPVTTIADKSGALGSFPSQGPSINNGGTVGFFAGLDNGQRGVFSGSGAAATTIYDSSGPLNNNVSITDPAINASGTTVFHAQRDALEAGRTVTGIYAGNGGPLSSSFAVFGVV